MLGIGAKRIDEEDSVIARVLLLLLPFLPASVLLFSPLPSRPHLFFVTPISLCPSHIHATNSLSRKSRLLEIAMRRRLEFIAA